MLERSELLTRILNDELKLSNAKPELTEMFRDEMLDLIRYASPVFFVGADIEAEWKEQIWERFYNFDTFGRI